MNFFKSSTQLDPSSSAEFHEKVKKDPESPITPTKNPLEETKTQKPKFNDPLTSFSQKPKAVPKNLPPPTYTEESRNHFPKKFVGNDSRSETESIEDLDNSPKAQKSESKPKERAKKEPNFVKTQEEYFDEDPDLHVDRTYKVSESYSAGTQNFMNYVSGGLSVLSEKKKQYVDPLVKTGIKTIKEWKSSENNQMSKQQEKKVINEKLMKVRGFLETLRQGSTYERSHTSYITTEVEEEKLHDMMMEIETMIMMTQSRNKDD